MARVIQQRNQEVVFEITKRTERAIKVKLVRPVAYPVEVWLPKSQIGVVSELAGKDAGRSYAVIPAWLYELKVKEAELASKPKPAIDPVEFNAMINNIKDEDESWQS